MLHSLFSELLITNGSNFTYATKDFVTFLTFANNTTNFFFVLSSLLLSGLLISILPILLCAGKCCYIYNLLNFWQQNYRFLLCPKQFSYVSYILDSWYQYFRSFYVLESFVTFTTFCPSDTKSYNFICVSFQSLPSGFLTAIRPCPNFFITFTTFWTPNTNKSNFSVC